MGLIKDFLRQSLYFSLFVLLFLILKLGMNWNNPYMLMFQFLGQLIFGAGSLGIIYVNLK